MTRSKRPAERARLAAVVLAVLAAALAPAAARAASPRDEAKAHFDRAEVHYRLGRFSEAIDEYTKAYEALALPEILFNIGQCHRSLGDHERAVFFFRGYLRDRPDAPNRTLVESFIAESVAKAKSAALTDPKPPPVPGAPGPLVKPVSAAPSAAAAAAAAPAASSPPSAPPPTPRRPVHRRAWIWVVAGAGLVAVGTSVAVAFAATPGSYVLPSGSLGTLDRRE